MCSKKADNYYRGNSVIVAGFFIVSLTHLETAIPGGYFYEENRMHSEHHSWKKEPTVGFVVHFVYE